MIVSIEGRLLDMDDPRQRAAFLNAWEVPMKDPDRVQYHAAREALAAVGDPNTQEETHVLVGAMADYMDGTVPHVYDLAAKAGRYKAALDAAREALFAGEPDVKHAKAILTEAVR